LTIEKKVRIEKRATTKSIIHLFSFVYFHSGKTNGL